jgi:hypothetical protein
MNEWILKQVALEKDCFYWLVFFSFLFFWYFIFIVQGKVIYFYNALLFYFF